MLIEEHDAGARKKGDPEPKLSRPQVVAPWHNRWPWQGAAATSLDVEVARRLISDDNFDLNALTLFKPRFAGSCRPSPQASIAEVVHLPGCRAQNMKDLKGPPRPLYK